MESTDPEVELSVDDRGNHILKTPVGKFQLGADEWARLLLLKKLADGIDRLIGRVAETLGDS